MMHAKALVVVAVLAIVMTLLTVFSPTEYPGGPLFMTAGSRPDIVGGAIGFIGNQIDPWNVAGSAMRTAFVYTPFWLPVVIIFALNVFSSDFSTGSIRVSRARGTSMGGMLLAQSAIIFAVLGGAYGFSCLVSFIVKAHQYGATLASSDYLLFVSILITNIFLICSLAAQAVFLFAALRSSFASTLVFLVFQVYVLLGYPSSYGTTGAEAPVNVLFRLSPTYYLMNTSSLSFENTSLLLALVYSVVVTTSVLAISSVTLNLKEA